MDAPMLTTTGAAIAALLIPFLTEQVKRLPWAWLVGAGQLINLALTAMAYALAWLIDGGVAATAGQYAIVAAFVALGGSAGHTLLVHAPAAREEAKE